MSRLATRQPAGGPAVFFDKDGTLVRDVPYNVRPELIEWLPGVFEALGTLHDAGFRLVVVTNQSGVAHGRFTERELDRYLAAFTDELADAGVTLDAVVYCPHHPEGRLSRYRRFCACRKPNPGMLASAAARLAIDTPRSWMIGDLLDDVEAGARAGTFTVLLGVHDDQRPPESGLRRPDIVAYSVTEAADAILRHSMAVA